MTGGTMMAAEAAFDRKRNDQACQYVLVDHPVQTATAASAKERRIGDMNTPLAMKVMVRMWALSMPRRTVKVSKSAAPRTACAVLVKKKPKSAIHGTPAGSEMAT